VTKCKGCLKDALQAAVSDYEAPKGYFSKLSKLVSFRTESQLPERTPILYEYVSNAIGPLFEELGYSLEVFENPIKGFGPILLAERNEGASLTVLGYGHGDVIHGQESQWDNNRNPWKLSFEGDKVYGRGTADNKGQHLAHITALKAILNTRGKLGFNHRFIIEMGEENGSRGFRDLVQKKLKKFSADVFFASDGPRTEYKRPNITLGNRGVINFDLICDLRKGGHHSGNWGGLLTNPAIVLANAIASIIDSKGILKIDALIQKNIPKSVINALKGISRDGGPNSPKINKDWGPKNRTIIEKVTASNTFEVLSFSSGNALNPVNAVPPKAIAACQLRFVMGTKLNEIIPILREHLDKNNFEQVEICKPLESNSISFEATRTDPNNPFAQWIQSIVSNSTNSHCGILPNSAGSNMTEVIQYDLKIPIVWLPLSYAGCSQHAPNEHIIKPLMREGIRTVTEIYWHLGEENNNREVILTS
jgi:acetylornithine deacetylase/succinyl-diaminopimelate desuccinylase-like protein